MKTILISTSRFGNPVSDYYRALAEIFVENNYKVIFVFDGLDKTLPDTNKNISCYCYPSVRPTKLRDFIFLYNLVKVENPSLCISNFGSTNFLSIVSFLLRVKNRINYVHTSSVALQLDYKGSLLKQKYLHLRKKIIYKLNTHFFTSSVGNMLDFSNTYSISKNRVTILPLLINDSPVKLRSIESKDFSVCIIGRLHPCKGHENLLKCFKDTLRYYPNLKLNIVGDGYLKEELKKMCTDLEISNNVFFLGNIPNDTINELFSKSLISISASLGEAYGLVNVEAIREGTPLICTRTSGSLDIVKERQNGLFFDAEIPESFSAAVKGILDNYDFYSKNAITSFEKEYSIRNIKNHFKMIKIFT